MLDVLDLLDALRPIISAKDPYAAQTRQHFGRLCIPVRNDSWATRNCITEEQLVVLLSHVSKVKLAARLDRESSNDPLPPLPPSLSLPPTRFQI